MGQDITITITDKINMTKDRAYYLDKISGMKQRQLEKLAKNEDSLFQDYLTEEGTLDLEKLSDADDVNLKIMFAEVDELEAGEELS